MGADDLSLPNRLSRWMHRGMLLLVGSLLVVAGSGKVMSPQPIGIATSLIIPSVLVVALGIFEITLGAMVLFGFAGRAMWTLLIVTFLCYLLALGLQGMHGANTCQCISGYSSPLSIMALVDLLIIVWLWFKRASWSKGLWSRITVPFNGTLAFVVPALAISMLAVFGSLPSAVAYFGGKNVVARSAVFRLARIEVGKTETATFHLHNYFESPVQIVGFRSSCSCMAATGLPLIISSGKGQAFKVSLTGRKADAGRVASYMVDLKFAEIDQVLRLTVTA